MRVGMGDKGGQVWFRERTRCLCGAGGRRTLHCAPAAAAVAVAAASTHLQAVHLGFDVAQRALIGRVVRVATDPGKQRAHVAPGCRQDEEGRRVGGGGRVSGGGRWQAGLERGSPCALQRDVL